MPRSDGSPLSFRTFARWCFARGRGAARNSFSNGDFFRRDVRRRAQAFDFSPHGVAVVALVTMQDRCRGHLIEQSISGGTIRDVAAGQQEGQRPAVAVRQGVDLRGPATSGAADGLIALPPFPPAAQRCAFTAELSISTAAGGPPAAAKV